MAEELNFPLTFYKCENCGGTKFIARTIADKEVEKGKITPGRPTGTSYGSIAITDASKPNLSAPALTFLRDICAECGHEQVVYVHSVDMPLTAIQQGLPKEFQNP